MADFSLPPRSDPTLDGGGRLKSAIHSIRICSKCSIERAVSVEPRQTVARLPVKSRELTADQNFTVRLQNDGINRTVRAASDIKRCVERSVRIQARDACAAAAIGDNFALRLNRDSSSGAGCRGRDESRVERAVGVDARDAVA